jgi:hypothetical protein
MPPVEPIDFTALVAVLLGMMVILIPVAGLTVRFALKPIAESIARMRESSTGREQLALIERRMALVEQEVQAIPGIRDDVARLVEELEFQRRLASGRKAPPEGG